MDYFYDVSILQNKVKVLILGSYVPQNFKILEELKKSLIEKGFKKTQLGRDVIGVPPKTPYDAKLAYIFEKIKNSMLESDFNIFIFFSPIDSTKLSYSNLNESTSVELASLVESTTDSNLFRRIIVFFPKDYYSSMVRGLVFSRNLNVFEYHNCYQIYTKAYTFIKQNLDLYNNSNRRIIEKEK